MEPILAVIIAILTLLVAVNMLLIFKLMAIVKDGQKLATARTLEPGEEIPALPQVSDNNTPKVLIYLDTRCPKCLAKVPELASLSAPAKIAGVSLYITGQQKLKALKDHLKDSPLMNQLLQLSAQQHFVLNPYKASPMYLFIDEQNKLQASGTIGDDNWQSFSEQISETQANQKHKEAC